MGGGPAGCAVALTLLRYTRRRVVVLEQGEYGGPRVGETLGPGYQALLSYLGLWGRFQADGHVAGRGSCAAWGSAELRSTHFLFTGRGPGVHLDRGRFDRLLAAAVEEAGGRLRRGCRVLGVRAQAGGGWEVRVEAGGPETLSAAFLVDAGGRAAPVARRLGAVRRRADSLVGLVAYARPAPDLPEPGQTLIEARPDGWWYSAEIPDGRLALAFMTDADLARDGRLHLGEGWRGELEAAEPTRARVRLDSLDGRTIVRAASSHLLDPPVGSRWIAVGDAALGLDPLSGMGIGNALASGMHAARAVHAALDGRCELSEQYLRRAPQIYRAYLEARRRFYALEGRWAPRPFWARRHGAPGAAPPPV